jgi:hypothetical protein
MEDNAPAGCKLSGFLSEVRQVHPASQKARQFLRWLAPRSLVAQLLFESLQFGGKIEEELCRVEIGKTNV